MLNFVGVSPCVFFWESSCSFHQTLKVICDFLKELIAWGLSMNEPQLWCDTLPISALTEGALLPDLPVHPFKTSVSIQTTSGPSQLSVLKHQGGALKQCQCLGLPQTPWVPTRSRGGRAFLRRATGDSDMPMTEKTLPFLGIGSLIGKMPLFSLFPMEALRILALCLIYWNIFIFT